MRDTREVGSGALTNADIARVLSPLLFFVAHVVYLAFWSPEPFLNKWLDGSFTFFLALVLCNVIRVRVVAAAASRAAGDGGESDAAAGGDGDPGREADDRPGSGHSSR